MKDLPRDFLSTSFGAALRPTIDNMFDRPASGSLSSVPQTAVSPSSDPTSSLTGSVHIVTNPATFNNFIKSHRAAVALFTAPQTCPPCRVIEPIFDQLAEEKAMRDKKSGATFAKIDINVGMGKMLATEWGVRATPTFMFFLDGTKVFVKYFTFVLKLSESFPFQIDELKGANANELRTQVDLLLFRAFPRRLSMASYSCYAHACASSSSYDSPLTRC